MYALSKLNKQHEQTWVNLQKRLNEVQFPYNFLGTTSAKQLPRDLLNCWPTIRKLGIILCSEVFDILNKLMKSDEDNANGDVQLYYASY